MDKPVAEGNRREVLLRLGALAAIALAAWVGADSLQPPPALGPEAGAEVFSAARASQHVARIAAEPHPTGSAAARSVRDYLLEQLRALGAEATLQEAERAVAIPGAGGLAARVENVIARLPGTGGGRALLVAAHYDSTATSRGAADNGAAVAACLEVLRALRAGPPLRNDVLFLFEDAEELLGIGANAFRDHPLSRSVAAVVNLEARGVRGPVWVFQTTAGNSWLIDQLRGARTRVVASSLAGDVYRQMPNGSDFEALTAAGAMGLNLAFLGGAAYYHTPDDNPEHLSAASLQHHGELVLELVRRLGQQDLDAARGAGDAVYFNLGERLIVYPAGLAPAFAFASALALGLLLWRSARRGRLRWKALALASLGHLALAALAVLAATVAYTAAEGLWPTLELAPGGDGPGQGLLLGGLALLAAAALGAAVGLGRRWASVEELLGASLLVLLVATAAAATLSPGSSALFQWPLALGLGLLAALRLSSGPWAWAFAPAAASLGLPLGWIVAPVWCAFAEALTLRAAGVLLLLVWVLAAPWVAALALPAARARWAESLGLAGLAAALLGAGLAACQPSRQTPVQAGLLFLQEDPQAPASFWVSRPPGRSPWVAAALGPAAEPAQLAEYLPFEWDLWRAPAPPLNLPPPELELLSEQRSQGSRRLEVRIRSPRGATFLEIAIGADEPLAAVEVLEQRFSAEQLAVPEAGGSRLLFWAPPPEGRRLIFEVRGQGPLRLALLDRLLGVPAGAALAPRPPGTVDGPFPMLSDGSLVVRRFRL